MTMPLVGSTDLTGTASGVPTDLRFDRLYRANPTGLSREARFYCCRAARLPSPPRPFEPPALCTQTAPIARQQACRACRVGEASICNIGNMKLLQQV
eukprot:5609997-Pleurochrysis_carterae.AAC.3